MPGVGAFAACMAGLREVAGDRIIGQRLAGGRPVLGVCVGMQILFDLGIEHGVRTEGCGEWPGTVDRLEAEIVPHMGWNTVRAPAGSVLFDGLDADTRFYFVHSYAVRTLGAGAGAADAGPAGDVGDARRRLRRRRRERAAGGDPVPPGEVRRRGRPPAHELAEEPLGGSRYAAGVTFTLLPAVDVRDGKAVRLFQGRSGTETGYGDPLEAALAWQDDGAEWIHLVDLDAAFGTGDNRAQLAEIVARSWTSGWS